MEWPSYLPDAAELWARELDAAASHIPVPRLEGDSDLLSSQHHTDQQVSVFDPVPRDVQAPRHQVPLALSFEGNAASSKQHQPQSPWLSTPLIDLDDWAATTLSPAAEVRPEANTYLFSKVTESLQLITKELASMRGGSSKAASPGLPKCDESRPLPSVKSWRSWLSLKLLPWCSMQAEGFSEFVQAALHGRVAGALPVDHPRYAKPNRALAFELTSGLHDDLAPYVSGVDKTNAVALLLALATAISTTGSAYAFALHARFERPEPAVNKALLQHSLKV